MRASGPGLGFKVAADRDSEMGEGAKSKGEMNRKMSLGGWDRSRVTKPLDRAGVTCSKRPLPAATPRDSTGKK